jgi:L-asparaginase
MPRRLDQASIPFWRNWAAHNHHEIHDLEFDVADDVGQAMTRKRVAFIGTGGTISAIGRGPLDIFDYGANDARLRADEILARFPEVAEVADVFPVIFRNVPSYDLYFDEWKELVLLCDRLVIEEPGLAGIVIGHGTASLEETAFFLNLTLKVQVPVVLVGAQRPASALSSDAGLNLVNAVRTAASDDAHSRGVLVLLNDEIHAARDVTKTSTFRLHAFRSPDFGPIGYADGDAILFRRRPERRHCPDTEFDIRGLDQLPRVDVAYSYVGSDGTAIRAFAEAGAAGIVMAGFAPGLIGGGDSAALRAAAAKGVVVALSTRAGSGRALRSTWLKRDGFVAADDLNPQKARLLLALALISKSERLETERIFAEY